MTIKKLKANEVFEVNGRYYQIDDKGGFSDLGAATSFKARPVNYESLKDGDEYFVMMRKGQEDLFLEAEKKFVFVKMEDEPMGVLSIRTKYEIQAENFDEENESHYLERWFLVQATDKDEIDGYLYDSQGNHFHEGTHYLLPESFAVKLPEEK